MELFKIDIWLVENHNCLFELSLHIKKSIDTIDSENKEITYLLWKFQNVVFALDSV